MSGNLILQGLSVDQLQDCLKVIVREAVKEELQKVNSKDDDILLSRRDAAKLFQPAISLTTLSAWCRDGKLQPHHIGGRVFFKRSEILNAAKILKPYKSGGKLL
jgi:hypothetical protein